MRMLSAQVHWEDVQAAFPDKCEIECRVFLNDHAVCIEETMLEAGLQEVKALGEGLPS